MSNLNFKLTSAFLFLVLFSIIFTVSIEAGEVYFIRVDSIINPVSEEYICDSIEQVEALSGECLVILLDTPGGLDQNMRVIIKKIMNSGIPIIVYVSPSGSQAASAGTFITMSAHIAAMSPGTNIGAATPVLISRTGGDDSKIPEEMKKKMVNNATAYLESIADQRGRNRDWVVKAIRDGESISAGEALEINVIDLIADDLSDLLEKIDGEEIELLTGPRKLETASRTPIEIKKSFKIRLLMILANPNLSYLLFLIGLLGIYMEISHPGSILPGVIGGLSLILALYSFNVLPVNMAGVLLIICAFILFILEIEIVSYGMLTIGGIVSLFLGSIFLMKTSAPFYQISWGVIIPSVVFISIFVIVLIYFAVRAQITRVKTGDQGIINEEGYVRKKLEHGDYLISIHGELWRAECSDPLESGDKVRVKEAQDLLLKVEKIN